MIRNSPCLYYIKYLLASPARYTTHQIRTTLQALHLDYVGVAHLNRLRDQMVIPDPFRPEDAMHLASQQFMMREKIYRLFHPDAAVEMAQQILKSPRAKEMVETLSLTGVNHHAIAQQVTSRCKLAVTSQAVERYQFYFWNLELVDALEVRTLLTLRYNKQHRKVTELHQLAMVEQGAAPEEIEAVQEEAYTSELMEKMAKKDPRMQAAMLPASPLGVMLAQARLGIMPKRPDFIQVLEAARSMASLRLYEAVVDGQAFSSKNAADYAASIKAMTDVMQSLEKPQEDLLKHLQKVVLKNQKFQAPRLGQDGANHTVSYAVADRVQPLELTEQSNGHED